MSLKIGLIGGLGWPATVAYYDAICRASHANGETGSPEMTIESLDMSKTLAVRGTVGDESSWETFDAIFCEAIDRLSASGCDIGAIASVTPHNRLASFSRNATLPIISIVDAVAEKLEPGTAKKAVILGTSVTMEGALFDDRLADLDISVVKPKSAEIATFSDLLNTYFYSGRADEGREPLIRYIKSAFGVSEDMLCILACTDLAPAFPDKTGQLSFNIGGINFLDAKTAHVEAILGAASP